MLATAAGVVVAWSVTQRTPISPVGWVVIALWAVCALFASTLED